MYIIGIKQLLSEVNGLKVYMEGFREKVIEIHNLIYPALVDKFGSHCINEEDFLETLFLTIIQTDFSEKDRLALIVNETALEPVFFNEEDSVANPYLHFYFKDKLYCIGLNDFLVWKTLYGNELKIKEMTTKHLEITIDNLKKNIGEMEKVDKGVVKFNNATSSAHSEKVMLSNLMWLTVLSHELAERQSQLTL